MRPSRSGLCTGVIAAIAASFPLFAQSPTQLRVDGVPAHSRVVSATPEFCWDFAGSQINWQIQVDDDASFTPSSHPSGPRVWFWDSGTAPKGELGAQHCARMRQVTTPGGPSRDLDRRFSSIHWRVRVQTPDRAWSSWSASSLRMNVHPGMPGAIAVSDSARESRAPVLAPASPIAGRTYYVAPAGDDENDGSRSAPFRTLMRATLALKEGDTLLVRDGIYEQNLVLSTASGHRSGAVGRSIAVRAFPGEHPILKAEATGSRTAVQVGPDPKLQHWVLDGLTFGGESTLRGIGISGARDITISDCRLAPGLPSAAIGIAIDGGAQDIRLVGCVLNQPIDVQVDVGAANNVAIRECEFTRFDGRHAIRKTGGQGGNLLIADSRLHDAAPREGAILLGAGASGSRIAGTILSHLRGAGADGIVMDGSGQIVVENNVIYASDGAAIRIASMGQLGVLRNNIVARCGQGIEVTADDGGRWTDGSIVDYNIFFDNARDFAIASADAGRLRHQPTGNCFECDPLFADADAGDFRLLAESPAIDAGDPQSAIPAGGGARVDIGRYEAGASRTPYEYEPRFVVADPTPRIAWALRDAATLLASGARGLRDAQSRYQIQIDRRPTFDSQGDGIPLLDSGVVESPEEAYTVPKTAALGPGEYYVRVRQWDDQEMVAGAWSDHQISFRVSGEPQPPYLANVHPAQGAAGVASDTPIALEVKDAGSGVDPSTVRMFVNGRLVSADVSGHGDRARVIWDPPETFASGMTVNVRIVAEDFDPISPAMDTTYRFQVREGDARAGPRNIRVAR